MMCAPQPLNPGGEGANQNLQLKWLLVPSAGKCETGAKRGKTYHRYVYEARENTRKPRHDHLPWSY